MCLRGLIRLLCCHGLTTRTPRIRRLYPTVFQIQSVLPGYSWKYFRSAMNPADCASRGLPPSELRKCKLYWKGPRFLKSPVETWTQDFSCLGLEQLSKTKPVCLLTREDPPCEWAIRFSSFNQMIRVTAQVLRFIQMCRKRSVELGYLRQSGLDAAVHI